MEEEYVEVELPDNEYFHEGVVGLAMDIVADCKMVVETVNGINVVNNNATSVASGELVVPDGAPDTDAMKETFVQAVKRVPQSAARLVDMTHQFIRENAAFYLDDQRYLDLFKVLQANTRAVKESVLLLLRLATVSVWRTKSAATTAKTQGQLESYCKNVALAIKQVIAAADELRLLQDEEEEGLIEEEAEELARLVMEKTVQLAKAGSAAVKELVEATYQLQDQEHFVFAVKSTLQALTPFVEFGAALSLPEADTLRKAAFEFLTTAKAAFQAQHDESSFARLESAKDRVAEAMRAMVLAARAINTEDIVRNQIFNQGLSHDELEEPPDHPPPPTTVSPFIGDRRPAAVSRHEDTIKDDQDHESTKSDHINGSGADKPRHTVAGQQLNQIQVPAKKTEAPLEVDLARYQSQMKKIIMLQRFMRKWLRISKFRNAALNFLIAPESERLRKRNMALWEIVSTERVYVNNLEELEKSIIAPLRATSHSFITEKEVGILFSNLESIICLNIQILESMEERMEAWPAEGRFADIFIKKAPVLRLYTEYLNNYERQVLLLTELEKKPAFMQFIKGCKAKMNLGNYLILPVQRLPRYEILLEGLKKYTSEEHVKELNQHVDKKKKDEDNRRTIHEIQKAISGAPVLFVAHRQFIREGLIDVLSGKKKEKFYVYLFTDVILFTKAKVKTLQPGAGRPKSKLKDALYLKDGPYTVSPNTGADGPVIKMAGPRKEYTFCFSSETGRDNWQKDLDTILREEGWKKILY